MTNEKTLTATNEILIGNELLEEYLYDETKKATFEKHFNTLVEKVVELVETEDLAVFDFDTKTGVMFNLAGDEIYDLIDSMYLSLPWEAPRWGKVTDRTSKCFSYMWERDILAREVAKRLNAQTNIILFDLDIKNDVKSISWENFKNLTDEQLECLRAHDYELLSPINILVFDAPTTVTEVTEVGGADQIKFDIESLIEDSKVERHIQENIACDRPLLIDEVEELRSELKHSWINDYIVSEYAKLSEDLFPVPRVNLNTFIDSLAGTALTYLDSFRKPGKKVIINLKEVVWGALAFLKLESVRYLAAYRVLTSIAFKLWELPTNVTAVNVIDSNFNVEVTFS